MALVKIFASHASTEVEIGKDSAVEGSVRAHVMLRTLVITAALHVPSYELSCSSTLQAYIDKFLSSKGDAGMLGSED